MKFFTKQEELLLLAIFSIKEGAYLVNIRELLITNTNKDWAFGSLYLALDRLRKEGYLESYLGDPMPTRGGKAIKYYKLTDNAVKELAENKAVQDKMWSDFSESVLKTNG
ncbi:MAG: hypothetical protein GY863_03605 [bacterium]|nr:hypothetical protein [bacterium]